MWITRTALVAILFSVTQTTTVFAQDKKAGAPEAKHEATELKVMVGMSQPDPTPGELLSPTPVEGATVLLVKEDGMVVGVQVTSKDGTVHWPLQHEGFRVVVALPGYKVSVSESTKEEHVATLLIIFTRNKDVKEADQ